MVDFNIKTSTKTTPQCQQQGGGECCIVEERAPNAVAATHNQRVAITVSVKQNGTKCMVKSAPVFKLVHSIHDSNFLRADQGFHRNGRAMRGFLMSRDGGKVLHVSHVGSSDHWSLDDLLLAAGVDMDNTPSDVPGEEHETMRQRGFQLIVHIEYSDVDRTSSIFTNFWGRKPSMEYYVNVRHAASSECKVEMGEHFAKYCVMLNFRADGERVTFAGFGAILSILAQSVSMITVTTLLVDFLAVYILREKHFINEKKFLPLDLDSPSVSGAVDKNMKVD